ncbi:anhydro-N-acetylmuramic acid kinase [Portibacter lacus]|uniref:Anhydro-N-acetylmuramic acid kinase n=1 Tax=Portibacter lacus TaxID=1099794 RepID=A0AA37WE96_9BACT|nr:anhydro-N-acetylmuramic acid kinase [Portibacter lacus]GLR16857.1 anhydro-N-acetylmuramic acid kinase [Portibacter lacus]
MNILGLMSGSSLDGLDMALCTFGMSENQEIDYKILSVDKVDFPESILGRLKSATKLSSLELQKLDADLSLFLGQCCKDFISSSAFPVDLVASHGHTIFHFPEEGFTTQLGNGGVISQVCERDVVCDFRSSDIGAGGLGAPFAPIADYYLFSDVDLFLNLGGISNITHKQGNQVTAFDISPANQILNHLAQSVGLEYDEDGKLASAGKVDEQLLDEFIRMNNFVDAKPRAIDNSWVSNNFIPLLSKLEVNDELRTTVEFINQEIVRAIEFLELEEKPHFLMATGGGALNKYLMQDLKSKLELRAVEVVELSSEIINYKEALLISLMGYLRINRIPNALCSVTGAIKDTIGGCVYAYR